ncbi:hypothetical protein D3C73_771610 [compost metagenome]
MNRTVLIVRFSNRENLARKFLNTSQRFFVVVCTSDQVITRLHQLCELPDLIVFTYNACVPLQVSYGWATVPRLRLHDVGKVFFAHCFSNHQAINHPAITCLSGYLFERFAVQGYRERFRFKCCEYISRISCQPAKQKAADHARFDIDIDHRVPSRTFRNVCGFIRYSKSACQPSPVGPPK